jgi:hypothetical protein
MRETDLYSFQRQLDRIDEARTPDGNFLDSKGNPADLQTQRVSVLHLYPADCAEISSRRCFISYARATPSSIFY